MKDLERTKYKQKSHKTSKIIRTFWTYGHKFYLRIYVHLYFF